MRNPDDFDYVTTQTCDSCGQRAVGVMLHFYGAPVLFQCRSCNEHAFDRVAKRDIKEWVDNPAPAEDEPGPVFEEMLRAS